MSSTQIQSVNIRPEVSILSILKSINYKAWYAIAEFIDNAIQSALSSYDALQDIHSHSYRLRISVEIDATPGQEKITIRDNAGGINLNDFSRAFRPASIPVDRSGLSEFGMGMKSAACWFSDYWTVRTSAIGEPVERTILFDVEKIVNQQIEDIPIRERPVSAKDHYTEITLARLNQLPQKKTVTKIKSHLSSMYRIFLRENFLELTYNNDLLIYDDPEVLVAPFYKTPDAEAVEWYKQLDIRLSDEMYIYGFAALRKVADTTGKAGFALLRRNRVILGSDDEGYRPREIFGQPGSFASQRVFGELHLEGFEVSHTKDGIQWNYHEEEVLRLLKASLNEAPIQLLSQAREYRARSNGSSSNERRSPVTSRADEPATSAHSPTVTTSPSTATSHPSLTPQARTSLPTVEPLLSQNPLPTVVSSPPPQAIQSERRTYEVPLNNELWMVRVELTDEAGISDWISLLGRSDDTFELDIRLALAHPFTATVYQTNRQCLEPLIQLAATMAIAEIGAQKAGIQKSGTFRKLINQVLLDGIVQQ